MENDLFEQRKRKMEELREQGVEPFSNDFKPAHLSADLHDSYDALSNDELAELNEEFSLAGRVVALRDFGKSAFFHIADRGGKIQGYIKRDVVGEEKFKFFKGYIDIGDFIGITGALFKTKTGELTLRIESVKLLTKALRPLPEKWHGLKDVEIRYRQRYLDLISNPGVREIFLRRARVIKLMRGFLDDRGFMEVETPVLQPIPGGAAAKPFVTHHNALDMELYMRIAPELYLKRLLVGGFERVYEIGRNFRNEGISTQHNPEFTMVELYQAYATYEDLMELIEEMFCHIVETLDGKMELEYQGSRVNFARPWRRMNIIQELESALGAEVYRDDSKLFEKAHSMGVSHNGIRGKALEGLFERLIGDSLTDPTFVYGFPLDISPLARKSAGDPSVTDRFELYIAGRELANAFSELNDPIDQETRFRAQLVMKAKGEEETHPMDSDFITALEHGMPPAAGAGIGIDRLVMLVTNSPSIREVLLFPHLKPE